jgi:hypothetical protein
MLTILHIHVENLNNTCIPIWVRAFIFMSKHHDIGTGIGIDGILLTSQVVCSIIDT